MKKNMKINIHFNEIFFYFIIISYAFDFGNIKYIITWLYIILDTIVTLKENNWKIIYSSNIKDYFYILNSFIILIVITIFLQLRNGFNSYAINETIFLLTPILLVMCYIKNISSIQLKRTINISFYIVTISFIYKFLDVISWENIKKISFTNSYSPFESELAYIFIIYEAYFITQKDKKRTILSALLCSLSFKRLCCIYAIFMLIAAKIVDINKKVSKKILYITISIFIFIPVITCWAVENNIDEYIYNKYKISLNELTLTRYSRLELSIKSNEIRYGLGSTTTYLTKTLNRINGSNINQRNLHNDLVKIYLECGIVGIIAVIVAFFKNFSNNLISYMLVVYIFLECYFNHLFGAGSAHFWIVLYLFFATNKFIKEKGDKIKNE